MESEGSDDELAPKAKVNAKAQAKKATDSGAKAPAKKDADCVRGQCEAWDATAGCDSNEKPAPEAKARAAASANEAAESGDTDEGEDCDEACSSSNCDASGCMV